MSSKRDDREQLERAMRVVHDLALEYVEHEDELPGRDAHPDDLDQRLELEITSRGRTFEDVAARLRLLLAETPSAASPRFLNQLFGGRDAVATIAEMLVPLSNTSMYTYKVAGAQVLVERAVINRMLASVPFPEGEGMFSPGGSLANLTAMLIARNRSLEGVRQRGLVDSHRAVVYTSADAHYSIRKAAGILGLGRSSVREVPTNEQGSMSARDLREMIARDLENGCKPVMINATAGTTVLGAVDPLNEIAEISRRYGIWLHVDGALGASLLLTEKYRHLLSGIEESDSLAWNAHKMMGVPLPCSVLLLARSGDLEAHLGEAAGYLFQADDAQFNPGTRSLQCGRRNDALKLWAAWQHLGDEGYDRRLTRLLDLARYAAERVTEEPQLELVAHPQTVNVCFRVKGKDSERICDYLDRRATLKIGHGQARGQSAIRLVCVDPRLDESRIDEILTTISSAAFEIG